MKMFVVAADAEEQRGQIYGKGTKLHFRVMLAE